MVPREQFIQVIESHGFVQDRFGHWRKSILAGSVENNYRWKVSKILARKEFQAVIGEKKEWIRLKSGYLSKLSIVDGKIHGMVSSLIR